MLFTKPFSKDKSYPMQILESWCSRALFSYHQNLFVIVTKGLVALVVFSRLDYRRLIVSHLINLILAAA